MPILFLIKNRVAEWSSRLVETIVISNIFYLFSWSEKQQLERTMPPFNTLSANQEYVFHTVTDLRSQLLDSSVMLGIKNHKNDCQKELKRTFLGFGSILC